MRDISNITKWFDLGRPNPTNRDRTAQLGASFEEMAELMEALLKISGIDLHTEFALHDASNALHRLAQVFKQGPVSFPIEISSQEIRKEILDACCDITVTVAGVATTHYMNFAAALNEVDRANWSKFVEGLPLYDENRKIIKGPNYQPPVLDAFVGDFPTQECPQ